MTLENRDSHVNTLQVDRYLQGRTTPETRPRFGKYHGATKEIVKGCITSLADLFMRIDFTDYPLENLVFSGQLEQICSWFKNGSCFDSRRNLVSFKKAYDCESFDDSYKIINICPNYVSVGDPDDELIEVENSEEAEVGACQQTMNLALLDDAM